MTKTRNTLTCWLRRSFLWTVPIGLQAAADDIEREFGVAAGGILYLDTDSGRIEIVTWDQNRDRVRVRSPGRLDVKIEQDGNDVVVVADAPNRFFGIRGSNISFRVDVPVIYNVALDTSGGRIEISDISGDIDADTSGGRIEIGNGTGGNVRADTSGGSITIGDVDGNVVADTSGGHIKIGNVRGDASADTSGGNITIGDVIGRMVADTSGGNIDVGEGGGAVVLDTSGGTIRAAWASGPISADTSGGNIYLAGSDTSVVADTSGGNIVIDKSNGSVYADTSGGNITIRQSVGPIRADTSGGRVDAELISTSGSGDTSIELESSGGDITIRLPADHHASIVADLQISRRYRGDYRIYTDFPLTISEGNGRILGRGDINGGGDRITLQTSNGDIHIISN